MNAGGEPLQRRPRGFNPVISVRLGDGLLAWVRGVLIPRRFETAAEWLELAGHYALLAAVVAGMLYAVIGGIKTDTLSVFFEGIAWLLVAALFQYLAAKFNSAGLALIRSGPSELSTQAFLSCTALLNVVLGLVGFVWCTIAAIRAHSWGSLGAGVGVLVLCELVVCLCLNPDMLNIAIRPASNPGQEAVGVLTFLMKTALRLVPLAFGVGTICGALGMFGALIQLLRNEALYPLMGMPGARLVLFSSALPVASYLLYILLYLNLDVIRAILILPAKFDETKRRDSAPS
jgi:hypothetical protein